METNKIKIAMCQLESKIASENYDPRPDNLKRAITAIDEAVSEGADLVVFGEIYLNGYESNQYSYKYALTEESKDYYIAKLIDIANKHNIHIIMGATTRKSFFPGDLYNSALLIGPEELIGVYNKTHVGAFTNGDQVVNEKAYWSPGEELPVFNTSIGRIGIEICADIMIPEIARTLTLKGAEIIVNISAAVCGFEEFWDHSLVVRANENAVWYVHVSGVGKQKDFEQFGGSRIFSPSSELTAEAPRKKESILVSEIDKNKLYEVRGTMHYFSNRNPQLYQAITTTNDK